MAIPPRVLYVDDEPDNCEMMRYWLRADCGMDVTTAPDGIVALDHIDKEFFDVYLLDYCLPDTTGIELCKKIRAMGSKAPIIIYSALDRKIDRQRALAAGADLYLVKPEELQQVKPQIERLLKENLQTMPLVSSTATPIGSKAKHPQKPVRRRQSSIM